MPLFFQNWALNFFSVTVKDAPYNAKGDGVTDDTAAIQAAIDATFGASGSPHGSSGTGGAGQYLNRVLVFPPGRYRTTAPLVFTSVESGIICGAGNQASIIVNETTGSKCIVTNGCSRTTWRDLSFQTAAGSSSTTFYLGWTGSGSPALTGNLFINCSFGNGDFGLLLGADGFMGSENQIIACSFTGCATAGIRSANANSLDTSIIGCSISECGYGIHISTGEIENILQCSFANNTADVRCDANGTTSILGCRTESATFISVPAGTFDVSSCIQNARVPGYFVDSPNGSVTLTNCQSYVGKIGAAHGEITQIGCNFDQASSVVSGAVNNGSGLVRLTVNEAAWWQTGDKVTVAGVGGVSAATGTWTLTKINSTTIDLQSSSFSGTYTSGGSVVPAFNSYLTGCTNPVGILSGRKQRWNKTADYTVNRIFSGYRFDNTTASGKISFTLPNMQDADGAKSGTRYGFYVGAAQTLEIIPQNNMTIRVAGSVSTSGTGKVSANTVGNYIEIECLDGGPSVDATIWFATSVVGTWTVT